MPLSSGLIEEVTSYDPAIESKADLAQRLIASAVRFLENETGWRLEDSDTVTGYFVGGTPVILLPQPADSITEVAVRHGSSWAAEPAADYLLEDGERRLIRSNGSLWPGRPISFLRTPGLGSHSEEYGSASYSGAHRIRVQYVAGLNDASDWPQDLLGVLVRLVSAEFRTRSLSRTRVTPDQDEEVNFRTWMRVEDWKILKHYRRMGRRMAA